MNRVIKFTVIAVKWFDKVNGNTYHSVRCIRHKDGAVVVGQFQYGYGEHYKQTALRIMAEAKWFPKRYMGIDDMCHSQNCMDYERENNYLILWTVSAGLKRDCIANGANSMGLFKFVLIGAKNNMKYHYKYPGEQRSACGKVQDQPDTFVLDMNGFVQHYDADARCKTCKHIVQDMSKLGYVSLSLMIIVDKWRTEHGT